MLGRLALVPVGEIGMIPFDMQGESADFSRAFCDKTNNSCDGYRWWYVNGWALGWGTKKEWK
jgi:hypothetical protein